MEHQAMHAARWPVTCDHRGDLFFAVDPLRPTCDGCDAELRLLLEARLAEAAMPDDEADRYEAAMGVRHG